MARNNRELTPASTRRSIDGRYVAGMLLAAFVLIWSASSGTAEEPTRRGTAKPANQNKKKSANKQQKTKKSEKTAPAADHPLNKPLRIVRQCRTKLDDVQDYTATFSKQERVGRRGNKLVSQTMAMKFREEPFSVYFYFQDRKTQGREVLFVNGRNKGQLLVHEGSGLSSLVGTVTLATNSSEVMKENRYPITEVGLKKMADKIIEQWEGESKYGETTVKYYNNAKLGSVECLAIESTHPQPRRQFKYHMTRVFIDKDTRLLVRVEQYGWPNRNGQQPPKIEEYTYSNIKTNVGLTDFDFDRRNKSYRF